MLVNYHLAYIGWYSLLWTHAFSAECPLHFRPTPRILGTLSIVDSMVAY